MLPGDHATTAVSSRAERFREQIGLSVSPKHLLKINISVVSPRTQEKINVEQFSFNLHANRRAYILINLLVAAESIIHLIALVAAFPRPFNGSPILLWHQDDG